MSKAVVDPAELRRFAHDLKRFNDTLHGQMSVLHGRLVGLGQTWRDQENQKFTEEFEQTTKVLSRFIDLSQKHIPFLVRKAERIEEYLKQR
ncbi:MAG TPA: WXG100 family type VII secretion target [Phycisphaerales bacterium]|nr:WXG100 family type VII secretion target [Phycisphaerales bacterium]HMP36285.1 WXG100 family type VII secretion target [Phycisphaerales bacterium]